MFNSVVNKTYNSPPQWNKSMGGYIDISDKITQTPIITSLEIAGTTYFFMTFPYLLYKIHIHCSK